MILDITVWTVVNYIATAVASLATVGVVIWNIYWAVKGEERRRKHSLPNLTIENIEPEGHSTRLNSGQEEEWSRYYILRVRNTKPTTEAREVRVRVIRLQVSQDGTIYDDKGPITPLSLRWASSPETHQGPSTDICTNFVTFDNIVLGFVNQSPRVNEGQPFQEFYIQVSPDLHSFDNRIVVTSKARVDLEVTATNFSPTNYFRVHVEWIENENNDKDKWPYIPKITCIDSIKI